MKVLACLLLVVVAIQALNDEQKKDFQVKYSECVKQTGVDEELIKKMRAGEFTEDPKLKAYVHCIFKAMKILDDKGEVLLDNVKINLPETVNKENALKVAVSCAKNETTDLVQHSYDVYKCYRASHDNPIPF